MLRKGIEGVLLIEIYFMEGNLYEIKVVVNLFYFFIFGWIGVIIFLIIWINYINFLIVMYMDW